MPLKTYTLENANLSLEVLSLGAITRKLMFRDRTGNWVNTVIGYRDLNSYKGDPFHAGAIVGRYAGRLRMDDAGQGGSSPEGPVCLHGGAQGWGRQQWALAGHDSTSLTLEYHSPDGDQGFSGEVLARVRYVLDGTSLHIQMEADAREDALVNMTNHNYYNLNGGGSILGHQLFLPSERRLELDRSLMPTGHYLGVKDTPFDLGKGTVIGGDDFPGYDDCYCLNQASTLQLYSPQSGIRMDLETPAPAVVVFTPQSMPSALTLNPDLRAYPAICLEPQGYPDAPHHSGFPSARVKAGTTYRNHMSLKFSIPG